MKFFFLSLLVVFITLSLSSEVFADTTNENEMIVRNFTYDVPIMEKAWDWEECKETYAYDEADDLWKTVNACYRTTGEKFILSLKLPDTVYVDTYMGGYGMADNVDVEDFVLHQDTWQTLSILIKDNNNSFPVSIHHYEDTGMFYLDTWNEKVMTERYASPSCTSCNWFIVSDWTFLNGKYPQINFKYQYSKGTEPFREIEYISKVAIIFHNDGYWRISTEIPDAGMHGGSAKKDIFELVVNNIEIFDQDEWRINNISVEKGTINENSLDSDQDEWPFDVPKIGSVDEKYQVSDKNEFDYGIVIVVVIIIITIFVIIVKTKTNNKKKDNTSNNRYSQERFSSSSKRISRLRDFRKRPDYVPIEDHYQLRKKYSTDEDIDELIRELENNADSDSEFHIIEDMVEQAILIEFSHRRNRTSNQDDGSERRSYEKEEYRADPKLVDAYGTLELPVGTKWREVKARKRQLALKHHPDRIKDKKLKKKAQDMMTEINNAVDLIEKSFQD